VVVKIVGGSANSRDRRRTKVSAHNAKDVILAGIKSGLTVKRACEAAERGVSTYAYYRKTDPNFRVMADAALQQRSGENTSKEVPDFPEFCEEYLNTKLFWHHLQWYDLLEGRAPRDLHPNQLYEPRDPDQILVNTPPDHAKSTTLTINYVTWRICQDPNVRILIISKTQDMAKKFLVAIKARLAENSAYTKLQADFGPPGGFAEGAARWAADAIYVSGQDSGEKDPTVQAVGIKGHIYGSRCDLAIMDDTVDHTNHQDYEKQIDWIQNQVSSRVADAGGRMLLVGTRMETVDLYSEIRKPSYYVDGESPWTYLKQPAVLEYADDPKDWKTLWPETNRPPVSIKGRKVAESQGWPRDGMWPAWPGPALARKRSKMRARNWSMIYQQDQVADDSTFKQEDVQGCVDRARYPGRLMAGQSGHRQHGMEGVTVIAGVDPAAAGYTAIHVWALDRQTGVRWVLEVVNKRGMLPHELREEMFRITERYGVSEWRIEKNAYQASLVQDRLIRDHMNARGVLISGHTTDAKKWDPDYGVASMATLFEGWRDGRNLIRLPSQTQSEPVRNFIEQLCSWTPETKGLTDTVMAAWFVEIRCRELMGSGLDGWHTSDSEFMSERDREGQMVVDLEMALQQGGITAWDGRLGGFSGLN
jgi:hypothetical protein